MNLFKTDLLDLWSAFDRVEGEGFFAGEIRRRGQYSILGAINWCLKRQDDIHRAAKDEWEKDQTKDYLEIKRSMASEHDSMCIYGSGGLNRYCVTVNGDIVFLDSFGVSASREKARKAGFKCR